MGLRRAAEAAAGGWRWQPADSPGAHTARELASGEAYEVAVRDEATGAVSEPLLMRTAAPGVMYTPTYRISEYTFEVASPPHASAACEALSEAKQRRTTGFPREPRRREQEEHAPVHHERRWLR